MISQITNSSPATFRGVLRLFVSSTFNDLQAERDELVKNVFPQLRALCESRHLDWCEVDLRWGITSNESAEGKTLPICFDEIDRCRPYSWYLRWYGGSQCTYPLISRHSILPSIMEGASVTEMEMVYGRIQRLAPCHATNAFFYMLDENRKSELDDSHGSASHATPPAN